MTSPTQLKYLDAMGIPVWVSRDIVAMKEGSQLSSTSSSASSSSSSDNLTDETVVSSSADSAQSILQSLNQQTESIVQRKPTTPVTEFSAQSQLSQKASDDTSTNITPTQNELARTTSHIVYACGNTQADWMIIGESPELNDSRANQPFADESGMLLDNMMRAVGLESPRTDAYMVNVIKSSMHAIQPESIGELNQILNNKIKEIKPKIIIIVGQLSAQNVLQSKEPLARLRAKALKHPETDINVVATYYPTHLLSKPIDKRKAWEDLKLAMQLIDDLGTATE